MTALDTAQQQTVIEPVFLIELFFRSLTLRYSTRQTVTYNGNTYVGGHGARVTTIKTTGSGAMTAEVEIPNYNRALSALVLGEGINNVTAKIRKGYGSGDTLAADVVIPRFIGVISSVPAIGDVVRLSLVTDNIMTQYSPRTLIGPPVFNHIPRSGTILIWGGETYVLER